MLAAADTYVVVLALTDMMAGVGLGIESLQKATPIISGFLLGYVCVLPLIGRLADLVARQRVLLGCLAIFVVGSAITALAVDLPVLVGGRFLQGIGGGGLVPATLALVADLWPAERRGTPLGVVGAVQELGAVLGPVIGAVILSLAGWRAIFWFNAALGVLLYAVIRLLGAGAGAAPAPAPGTVADPGTAPDPGTATDPAAVGRPVGSLRWVGSALVVLAAVLGGLTLSAPERLATDVTLGIPFVPFVGESRVLTPVGTATAVVLLVLGLVTARRWWPVLRRADPTGAALVAVALGGLVLTFASSNPEREVVGPLGLVLLPVSVLALVLYLWRHRVARNPVIPHGVVRGRAAVAFTVSLLVGAALVAVIVDVPLLARLTVTGSQTAAALVLVRFLVAVPAGALLGGWLLRRFGPGLVAGVGLSGAALGMLVMAGWGKGSLAAVTSSTAVLLLVGLGLGLALAPVNAAALEDSDRQAHGVVSALVVVARTVGMVVGLALLTAIGLRRYYLSVALLPDQSDPRALLDTAIVQVQTVFAGGAVAAMGAAVMALALGLRRRATPPPPPTEVPNLSS
ncbi:MAG: MFS transporter [Lapillicoccus sp.]